jgi:hypothetical protein
MEIAFSIEGGFAAFPGLARPRLIDTSGLPPEEAAEIEELIELVDFFSLPSDLPQRQVFPDAFRYTIAVKHERREHTIRRSDPIEDPDLAKLVSVLRSYPKRLER